MFNSNYTVSPSENTSTGRFDGPPLRDERSNRYLHDDRYAQEQHYHQQQSRPSYDNYGPSPSRPDERYSSTSSASGSLRRKSQQQDWNRPRGSSNASSSPLRPTVSPMQRPPPNNENAAVLDRMKAAGWVGVTGRGTQSEEDGVYATNSHGSMDSGYGSAYSGEESKSLGGWSALKKAVGLGEEDGAHQSGYSTPVSAPKSAQGSHYWDKLTATLGTKVHQWTDEDDDKVGEDGETKLGRAIREYHFSRALSVDDIPEWLFTPAELAARRNRRAPPPPSPSTRRRSTFGRRDEHQHDQGAPSMAAVRAAGRKQSSLPLTREGGGGRRNRMESVDEGPTGSGTRAGGPGAGRAADKLRAMREAKRIR